MAPIIGFEIPLTPVATIVHPQPYLVSSHLVCSPPSPPSSPSSHPPPSHAQTPVCLLGNRCRCTPDIRRNHVKPRPAWTLVQMMHIRSFLSRRDGPAGISKWPSRRRPSALPVSNCRPAVEAAATPLERQLPTSTYLPNNHLCVARITLTATTAAVMKNKHHPNWIQFVARLSPSWRLWPA